MGRLSAALLVPPGWTLLTGGPHLALPLLAGALRREGLSAEVRDWNALLAVRLGAMLTERSARQASLTADLETMNGPYFAARDALNVPLRGSTAHWEPQQGYSDSAFDPASPSSVRSALTQPGPLDASFLELAEQLVAEKDPEVVGISVTYPAQVLPTFYMARALRASGFRGPIVLGGNLVTRLGEAMALPWVFDWIDALVLWQGEIVVAEICRQATNRCWDGIPNLIWSDHGAIRINPARLLAPTEFGLPDFDGIDLSNYWGANFLTAIGSRGCYYGRCSFCSIPYAWGNRGFLGNWTPEAVVRQIEIGVADHSVRRFNFVDEALHPRLMSQVADLLIEREIRVEFEGYARFDSSWLAPGLLDKLSKAGLRKLKLGLELAPSDGRDLLNKSDHASSQDFLRILCDHGVLAHVFCMFGYPGTGVDDAIRTVEFALQHDDLIDTLDAIPFRYATHTQVPGVRIVEEPDRTWAVEHRYVPDSASALPMEGVTELVTEMQDYLWRVKPLWLHPTYRLFSAWSPNEG